MARTKIGRNDPCPCGAPKKYKKCHGAGEMQGSSATAPINANAPTNPKSRSIDRDGIFAAIENGVRSIRTEVARYSTADVVGWCKWPLADVGEQFGNKLVSQYRQLAFLVSVTLETPEPTEPPPITPEIWGRLCQHLNWLFLQYGVLDVNMAATSDQAQFARSWISKSTFLHYFNTGALSTDVQQMHWLEETLRPFDSELKAICGLTASDALGLYRTIIRDIRDRKNERYLQRLQQFSSFITNVTGVITAAKHSFLRDDFGEVLATGAMAAFWKGFVVRRGDLQPTTRYPTDPHHLESTPFVEVSDGVALLGVPGTALEAIGGHLSAALLDSQHRLKYLKRRDDVLESEVVRVFRKFYEGTGAQIFPDAHLGDFQNDLVILDGGIVVIVEAKAGFMRKPFRDLDKAFVRLKQNFDRVIGEAHEQASRTRTRLLKGERLSFLTRRGDPLVDIDGAHVAQVLTVCVTVDDFGPLARDMSILLDRQEHEIFPWAIMLNDVEVFLDAFNHLGIERSELYDFLRERATLHGRVESGDELEVAGYFLKHRTLRPLDHGPGTRTPIDPTYSNIFDELYFLTAEEI
jgi:hypothetical protein